MPFPKSCADRPPEPRSSSSERGSALILAMLVAVILAILGMGLLLQTSLGQQAAGIDRSVAKSLYAADAGIMMQVQMIQAGQVVAPTASFVLDEDAGLTGFYRARYHVDVTSDFCEVEPAVPILGYANKYRKRFVHMRSESTRAVGNLRGTARATVEADVSIWPFDMDNYVLINFCS